VDQDNRHPRAGSTGVHAERRFERRHGDQRHDFRLPSTVILVLDTRIHVAVFPKRWNRMKVAYSNDLGLCHVDTRVKPAHDKMRECEA